MNHFICTGNGFVKGTSVNENYQTIVEYTDRVSEAMEFKTAAGEKFIERHNLNAFIWKPFKEYPIRDMYKVQQKRDNFGRNNTDIGIWEVVRGVAISETDMLFLWHKGKTNQNLMTFKEAQEEAIKLNFGIISKIEFEIYEIAMAIKPNQK